MNEASLAMFKEKVQPLRDLLQKMRDALDMQPELYEEARLKDLHRARVQAKHALTTRAGKEALVKATRALELLNNQIEQIETSGPFTPADANLYATQLTNAIQNAERWAYIVLLNEMLDAFGFLQFWQDIELTAIDAGFEYFNRAGFWPEHWKTSRCADLEIKIMQLTEEISTFVMQEGKDLTDELHA